MLVFGLSDAKLRHRRFRQNEEAIFREFFEVSHGDTDLTPAIIAKKAGISRSTFYRHHRSVYRIRPDYEKYISQKYKSVMRPLKKKYETDKLLYKMLIFISQNRRLLTPLMEENGEKLAKNMLTFIGRKVSKEYNFPDYPGTLFDIYTGGAAALLMDWRKTGFVETEIEQICRNLIFLAKNTAKRLSPIDYKV
ncbi:TetR/AcrR family transcriptional regulator [Candidatus Saccharibacteria bacterium]|nr:TetR/AcrR family transcriptional regulator [Candidatus Saccharibacteria bacterium]